MGIDLSEMPPGPATLQYHRCKDWWGRLRGCLPSSPNLWPWTMTSLFLGKATNLASGPIGLGWCNVARPYRRPCMTAPRLPRQAYEATKCPGDSWGYTSLRMLSRQKSQIFPHFLRLFLEVTICWAYYTTFTTTNTNEIKKGAKSHLISLWFFLHIRNNFQLISYKLFFY